MWFRRDLRLHDHPALNAAAAEGPVVALFVLDDSLRRPSGGPRLAYLYRSLRALDSDLRERGGRLIVRRGKPENVVPAVAREVEASSVHISADFGPYGSARDERVDKALGDIALTRTGSPYAVAPGRVVKDDGAPYSVYAPFFRAWQTHGWRAPVRIASAISWSTKLDDSAIPHDPRLDDDVELPEAGETAARAAWNQYRKDHLADYA
jgi:deoxyribodipyrimidine photo-lyase